MSHAALHDVLRRTQAALCSPLVCPDMFKAAMGAPRSDLGAVMAYLQRPIDARPDVSVYFDRVFYAVTNPELQRQGVDPLLHFIETGFEALRQPHPLIDLIYIASCDPHALGEPRSIGALMELLDYDLMPPSPYFAPAWYRDAAHLPPEGGCLRHYLTAGQSGDPSAPCQPNPFLDPAWYASKNADVADDAYAAVRHFVLVGDSEGRAAGPRFDGAAYRDRHADVARGVLPPLAHYLMFGVAEGRHLPAGRGAPLPASASPPIGLPAVFDGPTALAIDSNLRQRLHTLRHARLDAVAAPPPPLITARDPVQDLRRIRLPSAADPRVSILIPVFNELPLTVECLLALSRARIRVPFEVIVADDASTDPALATLADVPNLVYFRQPANAGFLETCNAGFLQARGEYVLLLNNDTQVQRGAVDRLVEALDRDEAVAAAGPKLIYPNGRLQEAGCAIRADGSSIMVGLGEDPDEGGYNYDRDVAYCSGAALLVRRDAIAGPLFDARYAPAYCEDADLCLRLIAAGHRIRYVHAAMVMHHLSASTNRTAKPVKARQIIRNQARLADRWAPLLGAMEPVRTLAFYLPQFHPTPENDLWWGAGFTEWTNVARAQPGYAGQYQPHLPTDLGFYDLRNAETLTAQARLAARYGIEGFCVYAYNFDGRPVLSRPLDLVRKDPAIPFRWCVCWANENWTRHWDGGAGGVLMTQCYDAHTLDAVIADVVQQAADPRYIRVSGRPLFLVYRPLLLPDPPAFAAACRTAFAAAGFPGVHLVYVESMEAVDRAVRPADLGFDASVEFPPHGRAARATAPADVLREGWDGKRYDYPETVAVFARRPTVPYKRYPAVFPSWDNTPRQPLRGTSFDGASPEAFRVFVEEKAEEVRRFMLGDDRLLFVNAWNEWAEGAHLEPDTGYGHRWLEALRDGLAATA